MSNSIIRLVALILLATSAPSGAFAYEMQGPIHPEKGIRAHFDPFLNDPDSAEYRVSDVYFCRANTFQFLGEMNAMPTWMVEVGLNAKNLFGGYSGYRWYLVVLGGWLGGRDPLVMEAIEENMQSHVLETSCTRADAQGRIDSRYRDGITK